MKAGKAASSEDLGGLVTGILRFDPNRSDLRSPRLQGEGNFPAFIARPPARPAFAAMEASLPAASCDELMSLTSQQDSMR